MIEYNLITTKVSADSYQHRLILNGNEINMGNLSEDSRRRFETLGMEDAKYISRTGINTRITQGKIRLKL